MGLAPPSSLENAATAATGTAPSTIICYECLVFERVSALGRTTGDIFRDGEALLDEVLDTRRIPRSRPKMEHYQP